MSHEQMTTAKSTGHLEMRWTPTTDDQGRATMRATWFQVSAAAAAPHAA